MLKRRPIHLLGFCSVGILSIVTNGKKFGLSTRNSMAFVSSSHINGDSTSGRDRITNNNSNQNDDEIDDLVASQATNIAVSDTGLAEPAEVSPLLLLPASDESGENITSIRLGETISFAELGPIILNTDGTTRRINNWNTLTKQEQETTWRRIQKRNAERREQLLIQHNQQMDQDKQNETD
jgi:hypothetical protein